MALTVSETTVFRTYNRIALWENSHKHYYLFGNLNRRSVSWLAEGRLPLSTAQSWGEIGVYTAAPNGEPGKTFLTRAAPHSCSGRPRLEPVGLVDKDWSLVNRPWPWPWPLTWVMSVMADCKQRERGDRCEISRIIARTNDAQGSQYVSLKDKPLLQM